MAISLGFENGEVFVGEVFGKAVGNEQVAVAVIVIVSKQRGPAPFCFKHPEHLAHFTVGQSFFALQTIVKLDHVADKLRLVAILQVVLVKLVAVAIDCLLLSGIDLRQHIEGHDLRIAVVVDVGHVVAHRKLRAVAQHLVGHIFERTIPLIEIDKIVGNVVVGDVKVWITVFVDVADRDAEAIAFGCDPSFHGDVGKGSVAVVAVKLVVVDGGPVGDFGTEIGGNGHREHVVEHIEVKVSVEVVVEESRVNRIPSVSDPEFFCLLGEGWQTSVIQPAMHPEPVGAQGGIFAAGGGEVQIGPAVSVYVSDSNAAEPLAAVEPGQLAADVLEAKVSLIEINPRHDLVSDKDQVLKSILIEIHDPDATAVVHVLVFQDVEAVGWGNLVIKGNASAGRLHSLKKRLFASHQYNHEEQGGKEFHMG